MPQLSAKECQSIKLSPWNASDLPSGQVSCGEVALGGGWGDLAIVAKGVGCSVAHTVWADSRNSHDITANASGKYLEAVDGFGCNDTTNDLVLGCAHGAERVYAAPPAMLSFAYRAGG